MRYSQRRRRGVAELYVGHHEGQFRMNCATSLAILFFGIRACAFAGDRIVDADMSTPRKALGVVIAAEKRGDLTSVEAVLSRERYKQFLKIAENCKRKPAELVQPDDPYETVEVLREDIAEIRLDYS